MQRILLFAAIFLLQMLALSTGTAHAQHTACGASLCISRHVPDGSYCPGQTLDIEVRMEYDQSSEVLALSHYETLPQGWTVEEILGGAAVFLLPPDDQGATGFGWVVLPPFPLTLRYRVRVPEGFTGEAFISGVAEYREFGEPIYSNAVLSLVPEGPDCLLPEGEGEGAPQEGSVEGEGEGEAVSEGEGEGAVPEVHSADPDADGRINLSELLRVVQFYNTGVYSCAPDWYGSEDGYLPGAGDTQCPPHSSDYHPQDWIISLYELMRLVQFYNLGGYEFCGTLSQEGDDFCIPLSVLRG